MKIKRPGQIVIVLGILAIAWFAVGAKNRATFKAAIFPKKARLASVEVKKVELPAAPTNQEEIPDVEPVPLPKDYPGCTDQPEVRIDLWAWTAQMGEVFAVGGKQSTAGSIMCKYGVNVKLIRQDDPSKMREDLLAFATALHNGDPNPDEGVHFVQIMGDGSAAFLAMLNDRLKQLGSEYQAKIVGSAGYSRGEDSLMGPPEWKSNPHAMKGKTISAYVMDGDWNIVQKLIGDSGTPDNPLRNNPDWTTYDPDAVNWINASDYIDAAQKYIDGYSEMRPVVKDKKLTGEKVRVQADGVATWTPGDVNIAKNKGGLVTIVSTKEYAMQMPNVIIGIDKWMKANPTLVQNMLRGIFDGGDQVRVSKAAMQRAGEISDLVYNEERGADFWVKYNKGVVEKDVQGLAVSLGGSKVNGLADNVVLFGLNGGINYMEATYAAFGDIVKAQYPKDVPSYPAYTQIVDTSYVQALADRFQPDVAKAEPKYDTEAPVTTTVSERSWMIQFASSKDTIQPESYDELDNLARQLAVASGTIVEIHGHTDGDGTAEGNQQLSEDRAISVRKYLVGKGLPASRFRIFAHGESEPVESNRTDEGKAKNRRVVVRLGTT